MGNWCVGITPLLYKAQDLWTKCTGHKIYLPLFPTYSINNVFHSGKYLISWSPWKLSCWDCGFESCQGHGCLSVVSVVRCQVEVSATGWSLIQRVLPSVRVLLSVILKPRQEDLGTLELDRNLSDFSRLVCVYHSSCLQVCLVHSVWQVRIGGHLQIHHYITKLYT